jgi:ring-1,2-phenylacetyl-CoA epoxidase subunit PaaE
MGFNTLRVKQRIQETDQAVSILFAQLDDGSYKFKPGQYLTLSFDIGGQEHRRAYSICTRADEDTFGFAVKRVSGGKISNHIIDNIKEGDEIKVMHPEGKFVVEPQVQAVRDHYFIAAGSGITPVMSMISTLLEQEPLSTCYLLYANRNEDSIIFKQQLDTLTEQHRDQFILEYIISQPNQQKAKGLSGLFGRKASPTWRGLKGRITGRILGDFLENHPSKSGDNTYYICGPSGLISTVEMALLGRDVEPSDIKKEYFTAGDNTTTAATTGGGDCQAEVTLNGETFKLTIPADKTVLDAVIDLGKDPPYSCTSGACSTCIAKVKEGAVDMEACFALDDEEIEDGYVLACQSKCSTPTLKIEFEG